MTSEQFSDNGHKVGYKSPPLHTRFKKGQSGNPSGKKKKSGKPFGELVKEVANETIPVTLPNGTVKQMSLLEAAIRSSINGSGQTTAKVLAAAALVEKYYDPKIIAPTEDEEPLVQHGDNICYKLLLTQADIDVFAALPAYDKYD